MEPITDGHRRLLHEQVEAVTSTEAADTLMVHLPQGGAQALATKADVSTAIAKATSKIIIAQAGIMIAVVGLALAIAEYFG